VGRSSSGEGRGSVGKCILKQKDGLSKKQVRRKLKKGRSKIDSFIGEERKREKKDSLYIFAREDRMGRGTGKGGDFQKKH